MNEFQKFCGSEFWNLSISWYTSYPDLTNCFQNTVLKWIPAVFLILVSPIYYFSYLKLMVERKIIYTLLFKSKIIFSTILLCISIATLIYGCVLFSNDTYKTPLVQVVSPAITTIVFILSFILIIIEQRKRLTTSGIHFLFYFLMLACGFFILYSYLFRLINKGGLDKDPDIFNFVTFIIHYFFVCIQFLIFCFAENSALHISRHHIDKVPCPEIESSFLSRITFWWMNGLIIKGYKKALVENDLWKLNPRDMTSKNIGNLEREWKEEVRRCAWKLQDIDSTGSESSSLSVDSVEENERIGLLQNNSGHRQYRSTDSIIGQNNEIEAQKKKEPSLLKVMFKVYGPTLFLSHILKVICDMLTFVGPMLQSQLISFTENPKTEQWKGILFATLFFVTSAVNAIFFHQFFHIGMTLGMRIKASVINIVYKKALSMSNEARKTTTVGEIVNLMSVDSQRLLDATGYLWMIWSCPLQIILAIVFLWRQLGASVLAGLAIMILLIPINALIASRQRKLQISQMKRKDDRIKLLTEILNGIKVLKLYAWEMAFEEKVKSIRNFELETLRNYCYLGAVGSFFWTCAPFLVTLATFTTFVLTGGILDANKAFTALSLFNILRFPINALPMMLSFLITASVSIKRIGKFLQNRDLDSDSVERIDNAAYPISIRNGKFAWGTNPDDPVILHNINMNVEDKTLTAVVGPVGTGKSTLISAILGETEKLAGQVIVKGSIAYVSQQAWIQNATLRDNILFGLVYDEVKYNRVLDECALRPDLDILPGGDLTEIGEKGINLSGGQKQRVSLARAIYQDCEIYLLDDPLSAVDSHVGKHIFNNVIGPNGCLAKKTRIFVTHGIHFLSQTDSIVVLSEKSISEYGSYSDLLSHNGAFANFLKNFLLEEEEENILEDEKDEILESTTDDERLIASEMEVKRIHDEILQRVSSLDEGSQIKSRCTSESPDKFPKKHPRMMTRRASSIAKKEKIIVDENTDPKKKKVPTATLR